MLSSICIRKCKLYKNLLVFIITLMLVEGNKGKEKPLEMLVYFLERKKKDKTRFYLKSK